MASQFLIIGVSDYWFGTRSLLNHYSMIACFQNLVKVVKTYQRVSLLSKSLFEHCVDQGTLRGITSANVMCIAMCLEVVVAHLRSHQNSRLYLFLFLSRPYKNLKFARRALQSQRHVQQRLERVLQYQGEIESFAGRRKRFN